MTPTLQRALGKTFLDRLQKPVLMIGKDYWSIQELATRLHVTHVGSARILHAFCEKHKFKDTKDLYDKTSPYTLASEPGLGITTLYVLWQVFRAKGLNPERWYAKETKGAVRTFVTYKKREQQADKRTKKGGSSKAPELPLSASAVQV